MTASRGRMIGARILVVVFALLAVIGLVSGYIRYQALDTDTFRTTAEELIASDVVRDQVAVTLVDELYANVDVAAALEERLPPDQQRLSGVLASGLQELSYRAARRLLERPRVQALWVSALETTHQQLLRVLDDDLRAVSTEDGAVVLDLRPLVVELGNRVAIVGDLAERFGPDAGRVEILEAKELETAQELTRLLKFLGNWLWLVAIALWAAALWLARGRRRSILRMIAISSILAGLLVLVLRRLGGSYVVDSLGGAAAVEPAAQDAWDILTSLLRDGGLTLVGLGVIALVAVWLVGPSPSGTAARRALAPYLARWEIAYGAAATLYLLLLWWRPTVQTTRIQLVLAGALLLGLGVELLRRQAGREFPNAPAPDLGAQLRRGADRLRGRGGEDERLAALERLGRLREQGVLTEEEFAAEKAALARD
jgi:Short C-terminal domain